MLKGFNVTGEAVKQSMHHGDPLMFVELRHHHKHDWSLLKVRGALRIESDELEQHLAEIPHDRPIVVLSDCPGEEASARAADMLLKGGWSDVHTLVRGFDAYLEAGLPVVPASKSVPATKIMLL
jgi:rhodanese-related sulfurtransferase